MQDRQPIAKAHSKTKGKKMKITKSRLKRIIREAMHSGPPTQSDADAKLQDDVVAILTIDLLGYQTEDAEREDELYEVAQKIIELCKGNR